MAAIVPLLYVCAGRTRASTRAAARRDPDSHRRSTRSRRSATVTEYAGHRGRYDAVDDFVLRRDLERRRRAGAVARARRPRHGRRCRFDHGAPAAERAHRVRGGARVALHDPDVLEPHAERVSSNLRERRLEALPERLQASSRQSRSRPARASPSPCRSSRPAPRVLARARWPTPSARDVRAAEADADVPLLRPQPLLLLAEPVVVD